MTPREKLAKLLVDEGFTLNYNHEPFSAADIWGVLGWGRVHALKDDTTVVWEATAWHKDGGCYKIVSWDTMTDCAAGITWDVDGCVVYVSAKRTKRREQDAARKLKRKEKIEAANLRYYEKRREKDRAIAKEYWE